MKQLGTQRPQNIFTNSSVPSNRRKVLSAPLFTEADLRRALGDCFIPGQKRDVVSAALLRSATLACDPDAPGATIPGNPRRFVAEVHLTAPGVDDAVNAQLCAIVENRLLGLPAISRANVTIHPALFAILS